MVIGMLMLVLVWVMVVMLMRTAVALMHRNQTANRPSSQLWGQHGLGSTIAGPFLVLPKGLG